MKKVIFAFLALTPGFAFAQQELGNVENLFIAIGRLVDIALPIIVGLALLAFLWGLLKFIFAQGNEEAKVDGKRIMIWGLVTLFVMVSVWGLVGFIGSALNIQQGGTVTVPVAP